MLPLTMICLKKRSSRIGTVLVALGPPWDLSVSWAGCPIFKIGGQWGLVCQDYTRREGGSPRVCEEFTSANCYCQHSFLELVLYIGVLYILLWERKFPFNIFEKEICDSLASNKYCAGERLSIFTISLAYHQITTRSNCRYFSYILLWVIESCL